jgi:hypothetical protein
MSGEPPRSGEERRSNFIFTDPSALAPSTTDPCAAPDGTRWVHAIGPTTPQDLDPLLDVVLFEKRDGELERVRSVSGAHFVRLHGRYGFP